jgi:hypothetical protein
MSPETGPSKTNRYCGGQYCGAFIPSDHACLLSLRLPAFNGLNARVCVERIKHEDSSFGVGYSGIAQ